MKNAGVRIKEKGQDERSGSTKHLSSQIKLRRCISVCVCVCASILGCNSFISGWQMPVHVLWMLDELWNRLRLRMSGSSIITISHHAYWKPSWMWATQRQYPLWRSRQTLWSMYIQMSANLNFRCRSNSNNIMYIYEVFPPFFKQRQVWVLESTLVRDAYPLRFSDVCLNWKHCHWVFPLEWRASVPSP